MDPSGQHDFFNLHRMDSISLNLPIIHQGESFAALVSLGCAKNLVDSEIMLPQILALGYRLATDPAKASLIVVNTCGFLESAVEEAIETILDLSSLKTTGMCTQLVVAGCMVQRYGKKLLDLLPEVDIFLGTSHYGKLKEILLASRNGNPRKLWISTPRWLHSSQTPRLRSTLPFSAYVKIADGCSNHCTYCMIPHLRGPYRSRSIQDIVREATILVSEGVKEINLIAQDTTAFGMDRQSEGELIPLLEQLDDIPHLEWIRILYVYPDRVTPLLLQTMAQSRKVVPYLDIPLQHSVPSILNAMRRKGSFVNPEKLIDLIRKHIPAMVLRTSFIVGFPGETDQDFLDLLGFVERMKFQHVGVFAFSPEIGTRAAKMAHQVPLEKKEQRRHTLLEMQREISRQCLQKYIGQTLRVLIEGFHPETELLLTGRLAVQAPEVDGSVIITAGEAQRGDIVQAEVTSAHDYDLEAEIVTSS